MHCLVSEKWLSVKLYRTTRDIRGSTCQKCLQASMAGIARYMNKCVPIAIQRASVQCQHSCTRGQAPHLIHCPLCTLHPLHCQELLLQQHTKWIVRAEFVDQLSLVSGLRLFLDWRKVEAKARKVREHILCMRWQQCWLQSLGLASANRQCSRVTRVRSRALLLPADCGPTGCYTLHCSARCEPKARKRAFRHLDFLQKQEALQQHQLQTESMTVSSTSKGGAPSRTLSPFRCRKSCSSSCRPAMQFSCSVLTSSARKGPGSMLRSLYATPFSPAHTLLRSMHSTKTEAKLQKARAVCCAPWTLRPVHLHAKVPAVRHVFDSELRSFELYEHLSCLQ